MLHIFIMMQFENISFVRWSLEFRLVNFNLIHLRVILYLVINQVILQLVYDFIRTSYYKI